MQKVILTKEQAEAIGEMRLYHRFKDDKGALIKKHIEGWCNDYQVLNEIDLVSFTTLVVNGFSYIVEPKKPKFQSGEKIIRITDGKMFTLTSKSEKFENGWFTEEFLVMIPEYEFRKPTPEEIYWLETLGRKNVFDFKVGDVVLEYGKDEHMITSDHESISATSYFAKKTNKLKGIYPAESFKPFPKESNS